LNFAVAADEGEAKVEGGSGDDTVGHIGNLSTRNTYNSVHYLDSKWYKG
jgi:hypothetical protein